ncbi:MAG: 6-carboxytetrahydropterin synthase QueD [Candidatus Cloacimonadales bacterium]|jgi:6-pyruvoyltetrahydropterin/6-carboxytetrahydropterin synthase|nr:6-carboxytetrahydropterin synthase QueD [Candidatus Cloacimonadota bacterium]MDX9976981.1 6-carboxytetrahydropterin synthase QueD [Candidatus Cloacimonadales bacterium]
MYKINVSSSFSAAHKLNNYPGLCKNLHGHNWKVRIQINCMKVDELGMAIDFGVAKKYLNDIMSMFDHQYLNDLPYFTGINPTSENIARVIFDELKKEFNSEDAKIAEVEVWESDHSSVIYTKH